MTEEPEGGNGECRRLVDHFFWQSGNNYNWVSATAKANIGMNLTEKGSKQHYVAVT